MNTLSLVLGLMMVAVTPAGPAFEDFPVGEVFAGKPAAPDLKSHPLAGKYRTLLKEQAQKGANFAEHFSFVLIGCGTSCMQVAVLDVKTGRVFFPKGLSVIHWSGWWGDKYGPEYRPTSRLVIVRGRVNSEEAPPGVSYFEWTGEDFRLLRFDSAFAKATADKSADRPVTPPLRTSPP